METIIDNSASSYLRYYPLRLFITNLQVWLVLGLFYLFSSDIRSPVFLLIITIVTVLRIIPSIFGVSRFFIQKIERGNGLLRISYYDYFKAKTLIVDGASRYELKQLVELRPSNYYRIWSGSSRVDVNTKFGISVEQLNELGAHLGEVGVSEA